MAKEHDSKEHNVFDLHEIAAAFPNEANTLLLDKYLVRQATASARVFRLYRGTPAHYHVNCEEFLYVLSGRGTFWTETASNSMEFKPGHLLAFPRGTVHAMPELLEEPVVFLAVDVPLREPGDIVFIDPEEGKPELFIHELGE